MRRWSLLESDLIVVQKTTFEKIRQLLSDFDKEFNPPLSERINDLDIYAEKLYKFANVYTMEKDRLVKGFIVFYDNDHETHTAYLSQIAVKSDSQTKGIGNKLLQIFEAISINNGMKQLKLEVQIRNEHAIKFYKRNGFEMCGEASSRSIYMMKFL